MSNGSKFVTHSGSILVLLNPYNADMMLRIFGYNEFTAACECKELAHISTLGNTVTAVFSLTTWRDGWRWYFSMSDQIVAAVNTIAMP